MLSGYKTNTRTTFCRCAKPSMQILLFKFPLFSLPRFSRLILSILSSKTRKQSDTGICAPGTGNYEQICHYPHEEHSRCCTGLEELPSQRRGGHGPGTMLTVGEVARRSNQTTLALVKQVTFLQAPGDAVFSPESLAELRSQQQLWHRRFLGVLGHTALPRWGHTSFPGVTALLIIVPNCSPGVALVTARAAWTRWGFSPAPSWGLLSLPPVLPGQESW